MKPLKPIYTGTTYELKITYEDAAQAPIDITGATATLVIRRSAFAPILVTVAAVIKPLEGGIVFTVDPSETVTILDDDRETEKFLLGAALTLADGSVINLFQTSIDINLSILS
jgi:hypothetical protein